MSNKIITEGDVQKALYEHYLDLGYDVQKEVKTKVGNIDLIIFTNNHKLLIEIKHYKAIKHAIGQLINYYKYHSDATGLVCIYFTYDLSYKTINNSLYQLTVPNSKLNIRLINYLDILNTEELNNILNQKTTEKVNTSNVEYLMCDVY